MPSVIVIPFLACVLAVYVSQKKRDFAGNKRPFAIALTLSILLVSLCKIGFTHRIDYTAIGILPGLIFNLFTRGVHNSWENASGEFITITVSTAFWFVILFEIAKPSIKPRQPPAGSE